MALFRDIFYRAGKIHQEHCICYYTPLHCSSVTVYLAVFWRRLRGASRSAGCSWGTGRRWRCRRGTPRTPPPQCSTGAPPCLQERQAHLLKPLINAIEWQAIPHFWTSLPNGARDQHWMHSLKAWTWRYCLEMFHYITTLYGTGWKTRDLQYNCRCNKYQSNLWEKNCNACCSTASPPRMQKPNATIIWNWS